MLVPRLASIAAPVLAMAILAVAGCAGPNLWTDLTSVSTGRTNEGRVRKPARLMKRGRGWVVPEKWSSRGFQYGVSELILALERAANAVRGKDRRVKLGVADLSARGGGRSVWHRSHESGRDVDVLFYTADSRRRPLEPPARDMIAFSGSGKPFLKEGIESYHDETWEDRRFDDRRNWAFVEALLTDPSIRIQWIFVSNGLKLRMLRHAEKKKRPSWIVEYARAVVRQPGDSIPHDDHFHIRIYCTRADRFHGCEDTGPVWQHEKKRFKYTGPERYDPWLWRVAMLPVARPFG